MVNVNLIINISIVLTAIMTIPTLALTLFEYYNYIKYDNYNNLFNINILKHISYIILICNICLLLVHWNTNLFISTLIIIVTIFNLMFLKDNNDKTS